MTQDPEDSPVRAMIGSPVEARRALMTGIVDLGGDPTASLVERHELVAEKSLEAHVAPGQLEVGVTDSDDSYLEEHFAVEWSRIGKVASKLNF
jgi:hypothetical protein